MKYSLPVYCLFLDLLNKDHDLFKLKIGLDQLRYYVTFYNEKKKIKVVDFYPEQ